MLDPDPDSMDPDPDSMNPDPQLCMEGTMAQWYLVAYAKPALSAIAAFSVFLCLPTPGGD